MKLFKTILLLLLSHLVCGQGEKELLSKMNETYINANSFSMTANVSVYENKGDQQPVSSYSGSMCKSGTMYYSEMADKITVINSRCALIVDKGQQLMIYGNPWKGASKDKQTNVSLVLDTTLLKSATIKLKSQEGKRKKIELSFKGGIYEKIEVTINTDDHTMEEVTYFCSSSELTPYQKLKISYTNVKINAKLSSDLFSEENFIGKKAGKTVPVGKWSKYRLIDQTGINYQKYE